MLWRNRHLGGFGPQAVICRPCSISKHLRWWFYNPWSAGHFIFLPVTYPTPVGTQSLLSPPPHPHAHLLNLGFHHVLPESVWASHLATPWATLYCCHQGLSIWSAGLTTSVHCLIFHSAPSISSNSCKPRSTSKSCDFENTNVQTACSWHFDSIEPGWAKLTVNHSKGWALGMQWICNYMLIKPILKHF